MSAWQLAQLNVARMLAPVDSPRLADFVASLDAINALADQAPGFVWRLQSEQGDATEFRPFGEDMLINMSVWESLESLHHYVYKSQHVEIMRRRKEWFARMQEAYTVLWWIRTGSIPTMEEAAARLAELRKNGPTSTAFTFANAFPAPGSAMRDSELDFDAGCPAT